MVPAAFVTMNSLPLSANGKIDRRALPAPEEHDGERSAFSAPASELELAVATMWQEVLGVKEVGRDDNFFDLGGHSLTAARITSRIVERFGVELPISAIFERPTVAELCSSLQETIAAKKPAAAKPAEIKARSRDAYRTQRPTAIAAGSRDGK